jgi:prolipoprotein diacylglyceryltransferase
VGKYVPEHTVLDTSTIRKVQEILEIKKDGTREISPVAVADLVNPSVTIGHSIARIGMVSPEKT